MPRKKHKPDNLLVGVLRRRRLVCVVQSGGAMDSHHPDTQLVSTEKGRLDSRHSCLLVLPKHYRDNAVTTSPTASEQ